MAGKRFQGEKLYWPDQKAAPLINLLYPLLYGCFFSVFYWQERLPGFSDNWYNLAMFKDYSRLISAYLNHTAYAVANYPEGYLFFYGESALLPGIMFWILDLLLTSDLLAFLGLYVLIFTLNSMAFNAYARQLTGVSNKWVLFSGGLSLMFFGFNTGLLDNITYPVLFPMLWGLFFFEKWLQTIRSRHLILATLLLAVQIYGSVYNFAIGLLLVLLRFLWSEKKHWKNLFHPVAIGVFLFVVAPFFYIYLLKFQPLPEYDDFINLDLLDSLAFQWSDFFHTLHSNLLYGDNAYSGNLSYYWKIGFPGIITLLMIPVVLRFSVLSRRRKFFIISVIISGLLICTGPYWGHTVPNPVFLPHRFFPLLLQFKLLFKFYYLSVIGFCIILVSGLDLLKDKAGISGRKNLFCAVFVLLFLAEHLPVRPTELSTPFDILSIRGDDVQEIRQQGGSVLWLPAYAPLLPERELNTCFYEGRRMEYKYYYQQAVYAFNSINGSNLLLTANRARIEQIIRQYPLEEALHILKAAYELRVIIYDNHPDIPCMNIDRSALKALNLKHLNRGKYSLYYL